MIICYKIQHRQTGLFATKGSREDYIWHKKGAMYSSLGAVKLHLNEVVNPRSGKRWERFKGYLQADIIEYTDTGAHCVMPASQYMKEKLQALLSSYRQAHRDNYAADCELFLRSM